MIETHNAEEWVRVGGTRYRPLATVPALGAGSSTIIIGSEAYAEWRKLPASGTVSVSGATAWKLFDKDFALKASRRRAEARRCPAAATPLTCSCSALRAL